jgi:hypothetical protein
MLRAGLHGSQHSAGRMRLADGDQRYAGGIPASLLRRLAHAPLHGLKILRDDAR